MAWVCNDPTEFTDEMVDGFVEASRRWVARAPGGVIRSTRSAKPQVAVVIGGGSGHFPAFGGLVGPGLAHGAAMGNVFASPSAQQVYDVVKAVERGRGAVLSYGQYAGDVLNFDQAQERLRAEGIDVQTVLVRDDIASAPPTEAERRRGIAGDLPVFKIAGAAAERGYDLPRIVELAQRAADRVFTLGVAYSGCTLPGASAPLFTVPAGRMAIGLGIHGEPGIEEVPLPTADGLAELLVGRLLAEAPVPTDGARVVPFVNGLGAVKSEELYVVYRRVARLLADAGSEAVSPEIGEFCTSFDMAGLSLTLFWLDDELAELWADPVDTVGFRRGAVAAGDLEVVKDVVVAAVGEAEAIPAGAPASQVTAVVVGDALQAIRAVIDENVEELGRIDAVAGDGDHGIGMQRGARAAAQAAEAAQEAGAGARTVLLQAAEAWSARAGGTSGVLWGLALRSVADQLSDECAATAEQVSAGVTGAAQAIQDFGKAKVGDATMVDALVPFAVTLAERVRAGDRLAVAWPVAAVAAREGADATADLVPSMGRARTHAEKSIGTPDAGALSLAMIAQAVGRVLSERNTDE